MTRQEIFDTMVKGVLSQGRAAAYLNTAGYVSCRYRVLHEDGTLCKCNVGWLIPDNLYNSPMEGDSLAALCLDIGTEEHYMFLKDAQGAHDLASWSRDAMVTILVDDTEFLEKYKVSMAKLAKNYGLDPAALYQ